MHVDIVGDRMPVRYAELEWIDRFPEARAVASSIIGVGSDRRRATRACASRQIEASGWHSMQAKSVKPKRQQP